MILVTGATGFVGRHFIAHILEQGIGSVRACYRQNIVKIPKEIEAIQVSDISNSTDWARALIDVNVIVHSAARVHIMEDKCEDPLNEFRKVNTLGTLNLARQAAAAGVKRFIFLSTIKVNGEITKDGKAFNERDIVNPTDPYALSKFEAEDGLRDLSSKTGMEVVILRPVLIYGPGVGGNFHNLMKIVESGIPMPLGSIKNKRSLLSVDNLVDIMTICLFHPGAVNNTFLLADGDDLSTSQLIQLLARSMNKPSRLFYIPRGLIEFLAIVFGRYNTVQRLYGSLQVDSSKARELLKWSPSIAIESAMTKTTVAFFEDIK